MRPGAPAPPTALPKPVPPVPPLASRVPATVRFDARRWMLPPEPPPPPPHAPPPSVPPLPPLTQMAPVAPMLIVVALIWT